MSTENGMSIARIVAVLNMRRDPESIRATWRNGNVSKPRLISIVLGANAQQLDMLIGKTRLTL